MFSQNLRLSRSGSLPGSSTTRSSSSTSAYYAAIQRRDRAEHRSLLSLDLAESKLSERYGPQSDTSTWPVLPPLTLPIVSPLESHFSYTRSDADSLTSVPSPGPVPPRLPLPVPPTQSEIRPRSRPRRPLPSPPVSISLPADSSSRALISPTDDVDRMSLLRSSVLTKPKHLRTKAITTNTNRLSEASVSSVSTRARRKNRWNTLDTLEGRRNPGTGETPPTTFTRHNPHTYVSPIPNPLSRSLNRSVRVVPNLDLDPGFDSSSSYSTGSDYHSDLKPANVTRDVSLNPSMSLTHKSFLEPRHVVLPVVPEDGVSVSESDSYLDLEEAVVLEAIRSPLLSPPPPVLVVPIVAHTKPAATRRVTYRLATPLPPLPASTLAPALPVNQKQRLRISGAKGPVERPAKGKTRLHLRSSSAPGATSATSMDTAGKQDVPIGVREWEAEKGITALTAEAVVAKKEKDRDEQNKSRSNPNRQHSSSTRHKASASASTSRPDAARTSTRKHNNRYKSFMELDLLEGEIGQLASNVRSAPPAGPRAGAISIKSPELFDRLRSKMGMIAQRREKEGWI